MSGIGILNVGAGDTKLVFDKDNPAECIRAARIVKDMLRRGYALMVEVKRKGKKPTFQRVYEFKEDTCEYIIADMDPLIAQAADQQAEEGHEQESTPPANESAAPRPQEGKRRTKAIPATGARGVAIPRSAGG